MKARYLAIDSFCGAGGLALGLEDAGFQCVAAFDFDRSAVETYNLNLSPVAFRADARDVTADTLMATSRASNRIDLFGGGPPCQGFSKQKRGAHLGDERNNLVQEYARIVHELQPRFFMLENVDQLGGKRGKHFVDYITELLTEFDLFPHLYNAADYGLAQTRSRFIIVGKHRDVTAPFAIPNPTVSKYRTVGEVIGALPEPPEDFSEHSEFPNHYKTNITKRNIERFSHVPQGGGWQDIPMDIRLQCHRVVNVKSGGWPDVYGRLREDGQAPTITGGFDSFTRGRYGHPTQNRALTPREAARLQGFPDSFRFVGTKHDVRHQVGNAVPPPLGEAIGRAVYHCLQIQDGAVKAQASDYDRATSRQLVLNMG